MFFVINSFFMFQEATTDFRVFSPLGSCVWLLSCLGKAWDDFPVGLFWICIGSPHTHQREATTLFLQSFSFHNLETQQMEIGFKALHQEPRNLFKA